MNSVIIRFLSGLSDTFYIVGFAIIIVVANLFVAYFYCEKLIEKNKKIMFILSCFHFIIYLLIKNSNINIAIGLFFCYLLFNYLIILAINFVKNLLKKRNDKNLHKKLTYYNNNIISPADRVVSVLKTITAKEEKEDKNNDIINLTHIKNMIKRLDCCSLNSTEIEQIENLKIYISDYESGFKDKDICSGINDGLNAMLKIMAKYSV